MSAPGSVRVGCSGWQYAHWRGTFYPRTLSPDRWLEHYAAHFDTLELNGTFYRLPEPESVRAWARAVPADFVFAWKASRFLTHNKKLLSPEEPLRRIFERARLLGGKLGPVLYQLPPAWRVNVERLSTFLRALPRRGRTVVEVRDATWYSASALRVLDESAVTLCLHDMPGSESGRRVVGPFAYVRFHGATGKYSGAYDRRSLSSWARWLVEQARRGRDAYAYFNNDAEGRAPRDAAYLREALARLG